MNSPKSTRRKRSANADRATLIIKLIGAAERARRGEERAFGYDDRVEHFVRHRRWALRTARKLAAEIAGG